MFARVISVTFQGGKTEAGASFLRDSMAPIARQQPGWQGLLLLTDPHSSRGIVISLWEHEADMLEPSEAYRAQAGQFEGFLDGSPLREIYEVKVKEYSFILHQTRYQFHACWQGQAVIELSLDEVSLHNPAVVDFRELEAELLEAGSAQNLADLIEALLARWPLQAQSQSKFERAWFHQGN